MWSTRNRGISKVSERTSIHQTIPQSQRTENSTRTYKGQTTRTAMAAENTEEVHSGRHGNSNWSGVAVPSV